MKSAIALLVALSAMSSTADAKCMQLTLQPFVLTSKAQLSPTGGGIVVGTMGAARDDKAERADDVPNWKIRGGKKLEAPVVTTLAPGLVLYSTPSTGDLINGKNKRIGTLTRTKATLPGLEAPKVKALTHRGNEVMRKRPDEETLVELEGKIPATAIAMILYDAKGTALTWNMVTPSEDVSAVRVYSFGHCDVANGTKPPAVGDKVTLVWVDRNGRLSPPTAPIVVAKGS